MRHYVNGQKTYLSAYFNQEKVINKFDILFRDNNQFGYSFYGEKKTIRNKNFTHVFLGL
jgi:hypothetical protein